MKWKRCARFPAYEVSENGDVRRAIAAKTSPAGRELIPRQNRNGYLTFHLREAGRHRHVGAHQLVAEAFLGPKPFDKAEVCHNDGTRTNNHFTNLRWDTRANNQADRLKHGTDCRGERSPNARLSAANVVQLRKDYASGGVRQRQLAERYLISQAHTSRIIRGTRWAA